MKDEQLIRGIRGETTLRVLRGAKNLNPQSQAMFYALCSMFWLSSLIFHISSLNKSPSPEQTPELGW